MAQKRVEMMFKELALKYNLPPHVIEEVFMSQFKRLREEISSLEFKTVKLPAWGKYIARPKKTQSVKDFYENRDKQKQEQLNNDRTNSNEGT